jgi:hypothetical protein
MLKRLPGLQLQCSSTNIPTTLRHSSIGKGQLGSRPHVRSHQSRMVACPSPPLKCLTPAVVWSRSRCAPFDLLCGVCPLFQIPLPCMYCPQYVQSALTMATRSYREFYGRAGRPDLFGGDYSAFLPPTCLPELLMPQRCSGRLGRPTIWQYWHMWAWIVLSTSPTAWPFLYHASRPPGIHQRRQGHCHPRGNHRGGRQLPPSDTPFLRIRPGSERPIHCRRHSRIRGRPHSGSIRRGGPQHTQGHQCDH